MENLRVSLKTYLARTILAAFEHLPYMYVVHVIISLPQLRLWRKTKAPKVKIAPSRRALHEMVAREVMNEKILYLEFGVYKGESIKYWLHLNRNPHSRFIGFDTFKGLPEAWQRNFKVVEKNTFSTGGLPPSVDDTRCTFQVGLFQQTLRPLLEYLDRTQYDRLIVHMDADIYTATLFVLCECDSILRSGDLIIFDEFSSVLNEYKALEDWSRAYMRQYEVLFLTRWMHQVSIRVS